jgi:predicted HAD superfamily Cof-like phosphohydrolase
MTNLQTKLLEFHLAKGHHVASRPSIPPDSVVRLRARLIIEEAFEVLEALFDDDSSGLSRLKREALRECNTAEIGVDMVALADALGDTDYVVEGTRVSFGIDGDPISAEIHRSNMSKPTTKDEHGKTIKQADWTPPDIEGELRRQGYDGRGRNHG